VNRKTGLAKVPCSHWIGACLEASGYEAVSQQSLSAQIGKRVPGSYWRGG
jgi:hypothetical protein